MNSLKQNQQNTHELPKIESLVTCFKRLYWCNDEHNLKYDQCFAARIEDRITSIKLCSDNITVKELDTPTQAGELRNAIEKLRNGKAVGVDLIMNDMLSNGKTSTQVIQHESVDWYIS